MLSVHGIPASIRNVRSVLPAAICHFGSRCPLPARGRVAEGREGAVALWGYRTITISPSPSVRWGRVAERSKAGRGRWLSPTTSPQAVSLRQVMPSRWNDP